MNKESKKTFHDLLDAVCKAFKDGVLEFFEIGNDGTSRYLMASHNGRDLLFYEDIDGSFGGHNSHIEFIESLYTPDTETFVIEGYKDIKRIKKEADIELANELKVKAYDEPFRHDEGWKVRCANGQQSGILDIFALKGATVTQRKSKK